MTIHKLAFFIENNDKDVYSGRKIDLDAFRYACKAFGVSEMAAINTSNLEIELNDRSIKYKEYSSFDEFHKNNSQDKLLLTEVPWSAPASSYKLGKDLPDFDWLVIGPSYGWIPHPQNVDWLTVPQDGKGALHSQHIATLILGYLFIEK